MSIVSISRLGIFDPAIAYHSAAQEFLSTQAYQITSGSQALSAELHASSPEQADEFDHVMAALAQRFNDEALLGGEAVGYLTSHHEFLANREAILSGSSPQPLPDVLAPDTSSWLQIHRTPLHGCFDELERKLREGAGDLDAFESRVKDFERIIWIAVNQPDQLKFHVDVPTAGWEPDWMKAGVQDLANFGTEVAGDTATLALRPAIDFIQAHQSDIYSMLDNMRQGFDKIFIPRTDPDVLQTLIDFLTALKAAYDRFIRGLFDDATRAVATEYSPPSGQDTYQKVWPTIPHQQYQTSMAIDQTIAQLEQLQRQNEAIAIATVAIIGGVVVFSIALVASFFIVPLVGSLPAMFMSGNEVVISVGGVTINITAIAGLLAAFFTQTFLGVAVWEWTAIAALTIASIALWNANHPVQTSKSRASIVQKIWDDYAKDLGQVITKVLVATLICLYGPNSVRSFFDLMVAVYTDVRILAASHDPSVVVKDVSWKRFINGIGNQYDSWAQNLLHAIMMVGPENVRDISRPIPAANGGGDVDLVVGDPPNQRFIEVGGPAKGDADNLDAERVTWPREIAYARSQGATPQLYIQKPPPDSSAMPQYRRAVDLGQQLFGGKNVIQMPPLSSDCYRRM